MNKQFLNQIENLNKELKDLKERLQKLELKADNIVKDSVNCSSDSFPYIQHHCVIEGIDDKKNRAIKKYKRIIKDKEIKLQKLINKLEYELNYIDDSELRMIIRYKYEDGLNWLQIMFKMEYKSESKARMKLERFLKNSEKNLNCAVCASKTC